MEKTTKEVNERKYMEVDIYDTDGDGFIDICTMALSLMDGETGETLDVATIKKQLEKLEGLIKSSDTTSENSEKLIKDLKTLQDKVENVERTLDSKIISNKIEQTEQIEQVKNLIINIQNVINTKADKIHMHDEYANKTHTHSYNDLTDKPNMNNQANVDVIDKLDSTSSTGALSANQGKILNEKIEEIKNTIKNNPPIDDEVNNNEPGIVNETLPKQVENFEYEIINPSKIKLKWHTYDKECLAGYSIVYKRNGIPSNAKDGTKIDMGKDDISCYIDYDINSGYYVRIFPYNSKQQYQTTMAYLSIEKDKKLTVGELPIGSKIKMGMHQVASETPEEMTWILLDHNHSGYPENSTTLLTEKVVDKFVFDAKEPNNPIDSGVRSSGYARYSKSNVRQWLNRNGLNWFEKQHYYDEPPIESNVSHNNKEDDFLSKKGFLSSFSSDELNIIVPSKLITPLNNIDSKLEGKTEDETTDMIFLLSKDEFILNSKKKEDFFEIFNIYSHYKRAQYTKSAFENLKCRESISSIIESAANWWVRTPISSACQYNNATGNVGPNRCHGIRPATNIKSSTVVYSQPNSDGVYTLKL